MTQMEKQQLRVLAILDQSEVSFGDLANTINSPSNQIRQLTNNLEQCGIVLGQLFMPIVEKVLPVVNGLSIAIRQLLVDMAGFMGITIDLDSYGEGFNDTEDSLDGVTDSLDEATESANALKKSLRGFDKLNVITTTSASADSGVDTSTIDLTSQIVAATEKYQKAWDEAYAKMENRAEEFAKKISVALEPVKKIFQDFAVGDYFQAGQDVSNLVVSINEFFTKAIQNVDWEAIGKNIGDFFAGINWIEILSSFGQLFWNAINAAIKTWKSSFDTAPIETTILTGIVGIPMIGKNLKKIGGAFSGIAEIFGGSSLFAKISEMFALWSGGAGTLGESFYAVFGVGGIITVALAAFVAGLGLAYSKNEEVRQSFQDSISTIGEGFTPILTTITDTILPDLQNGWNEFLNILKPLGDFLNETFVSIWQDMINPALEYLGTDILPMLNSVLEKTWNEVFVPFGEFLGKVLTPIIDVISWALGLLWKNVIVPLANAVGNILGKAFEGLVDIWNEIVLPGLNAIITIFTWLWDNVLEPLGKNIADKLGPVFEDVFKTIGGVIDGLSKALGGVIDFITGAFTGNWKKAWNGVVDIFKGIFNGVGSIVETVINFIIKGINGFLNGFDGIVSGFGNIIGIDISIPKIEEIDIPKFQTGGFPEDGWFRASKGEYFGSFDDGTSVIANNNQIISGIANGVKSANEEQNALLREQNALLRQILAKETGISSRDAFNAVRTEASNYTRRTGQPAF